MSQFNLEFSAVEGEQAAIGINTGTTNVDLTSREVLAIDLSPLEQCIQLQQIILSHNKLEQINLSPIRHCEKLTVLQLDYNLLESIDLNVLENFQELRHLNLSQNKLTTIDLAPMTNSTGLIILELDFNVIQKIDLNPLQNSIGLRALGLNNNQLTAIDLSPISQFNQLTQLKLRSNKLSEINLAHLNGCISLETLDISHNPLETLDLKPIATFTKLQRVGLSGCGFTDIDLGPFSEISSLVSIWLGDNRLKQVDLTPLAGQHELQSLDLSGNEITDVDISPLSTCVGLQRLRLNDNPLSVIELRPLSGCPALGALNLEETSLEKLDVSALFACKNLVKLEINNSVELLVNPVFKFREMPSWLSELQESIVVWQDYERRALEIGWPQTFTEIQSALDWNEERDWYAAQRGILEGFGIGELGGLDCNPKWILERAEDASDYRQAQNSVIEGVVDLLEKQFEQGGSTLFLDIEELSQSRASRLIPKIHELREREINETFIPVVQGMADLRYLWCTNYGFSILSTMSVKEIWMNLRMLRKIQAAMERIDVTLKLEEEPEKPELPSVWSNTSDSLKEYVFRTFAETERWR